MDLRQRGVAVEPVERLGYRHRVHRLVLERDVLGGAREGGHAGHRLDETLAHLGNRLHGDHIRSELRQEPRQLPRPRGEVEDGARRLDSNLLDQPPDCFERVRRPPALVIRGREREAARSRLVDGTAHPPKVTASPHQVAKKDDHPRDRGLH
jgi:hypothetical protein